METTKSLLASKTFLGVVVSVLAKFGAVLGYDVDGQAEDQLVSMIMVLVGLGGDFLALYGRVTATKKIGV